MKNNLVGLLVLTFGLASVAAAQPRTQELVATDEGDITFSTPSGNIGCHYIPTGGTSVYEPRDGGPELQCDRVEPSYVAVILGPKGRAIRIDNPGEQGCCNSEQVLAYGNSWSRGPFTCLSQTSGLTCRSTNGHGFSISRAKITVK